MRFKGLMWLLLLMIGCVPVYSQTVFDPMKQVAGVFEGTWKTDGKENYESWEKVCNLDLAGKGYTIENGNEKITEKLVIRFIDGKLYLLATVLDQNEGATVKFARTNTGDDEFVFENPEHDFPKKIVYRKLSAAEILVRVEGDAGKGFSYTIRKIEKAK